MAKKNSIETPSYSLYYCHPNMEQNLMNLARIISNIPTIIHAFEGDNPAYIIYPLVDTILNSTEGIQYIVIMNLQGIRYSHPNPNLIGDSFVGGDEELAIKEGKEYISIAEGTLGLATRAFVPINNFEGERIGVVCVGALNSNHSKNSLVFKSKKLFMVLAGAIGGLMSASPTSLEKMFYRLGKISNKINNRLWISKKDMVKGNLIEREESHINTTDISSYGDIKTFGIFNNKQSIEDILAIKEELKGSKMMINTLGENSHEMMNKLHVIMGLIELKEYEELKKYVNTFFYNKQYKTSNIIKNIENTAIAALLISKNNLATELGVDLIFHSKTKLTKDYPISNTNGIVTILGNLIDNGFDALQSKEDNKWIKILIKNNTEELLISIRDNGIGMEEENREIIYENGFSTKGKGRGTGLYIVNKIVRNLNGETILYSWQNKGTHFIIKLPKSRGNKSDKGFNS